MKTLLIATATLAASLSPFSGQEPRPAPDRLGLTSETIASLEVSDLKASVDWYRETLGFEMYLDLMEMGWVEVCTPTTNFKVGLGTPQPGAEPNTNGASAIVFGTKDIDKARAWLVSKNVEVGEVCEIPGIVRLLEFQDPDGNRLMLHQAAQSQ